MEGRNPVLLNIPHETLWSAHVWVVINEVSEVSEACILKRDYLYFEMLEYNKEFS